MPDAWNKEFSFVKELGQGAFGTVDLYTTGQDKFCAVKKINLGQKLKTFDSKTSLKRAQAMIIRCYNSVVNEINVMNRMHHENIIRIQSYAIRDWNDMDLYFKQVYKH